MAKYLRYTAFTLVLLLALPAHQVSALINPFNNTAIETLSVSNRLASFAHQTRAKTSATRFVRASSSHGSTKAQKGGTPLKRV